jgi:hypothetical protein
MEFSTLLSSEIRKYKMELPLSDQCAEPILPEASFKGRSWRPSSLTSHTVSPPCR